jgi:molybdopterin-containing oxidoreductase family iron-sulfur binding subunit
MRAASDVATAPMPVLTWHPPEWPEEAQAYLNPDVSIRPKGVVEKCTFCHHRLQKAKEEARAEERELRPGDYIPACVEICPADAMFFGDLDDPGSQVSQLAKSPRAFRLLEELGTEPKVIYLKEGE